MMLRWVAAGVLEAVKGFRRLKGYADMRRRSPRTRPTAWSVDPRDRGTCRVEGKCTIGMANQHTRPESGTTVVLASVPPGLLDGVPQGDQEAIAAIVGQAVRLVDYDDVGRAELEFTDKRGDIHYIYVKPEYLRPVE